MDFINDNLVWIIVGGVFFVMVIIGYYAEKTDFGRKTFEKRVKEPQQKVKSKKEEKRQRKLEEKQEKENKKKVKVKEDIRLADAVNDDEKENNKEESIEPTNAADYFDNMPMMENNIELNNESEDYTSSEDLTVPLASYDTEENNYRSSNDDYYGVQEDLTVPFGEKTNNNIYEGNTEIPSIDEVEEEVTDFGKNVSELEIETPNIEEVVSDTENNKVVEDDDVWNF